MAGHEPAGGKAEAGVVLQRPDQADTAAQGDHPGGGEGHTTAGRRRFTWHKWASLLLAIPAIGVAYLHAAPATDADLLIYATAGVVGAAFGLAANLATGLDRDSA